MLPSAAAAQDNDELGEYIPSNTRSIGITAGYVERRGGGASTAFAASTLTYTEFLTDFSITVIGFVTAATSDFAESSVSSDSRSIGGGGGVSQYLGGGLAATAIVSVVQNGATLDDTATPQFSEVSSTKNYSASFGLTQFVPVAPNMFLLAGMNVTPSLTRVDNDDRGDSNFSAIRGDATLSFNYVFSPRIAVRASGKASYGSRPITLSGKRDLYAAGVGSQYTFDDDLELRAEVMHERNRDHRGNLARISLTKGF